jgi:hypothetical protein
LNFQLWVLAVEVLDLCHHVCHELLPSEPRLDRHHQQLIHQFLDNQLLNGRINRRLRLDAETHLHAVTADGGTELLNVRNTSLRPPCSDS